MSFPDFSFVKFSFLFYIDFSFIKFSFIKNFRKKGNRQDLVTSLGYITFMFSPRKDTIYLVRTQNVLKKLEFLLPYLHVRIRG